MTERREIEIANGERCKACQKPFGSAPPAVFLTTGWTDDHTYVDGICFPCALKLGIRGFTALFNEAAEKRPEVARVLEVLQGA